MAGIKSVQYGLAALPGTQGFGSFNITAVDVRKAAVSYLGATCGNGGGIQDGRIRLALTPTGTAVDATRAGVSQAADARFCVYEFD